MEWSCFLAVFSSQSGIWGETRLTRAPGVLELINGVDGTTNMDRRSSNRMIESLKKYFGADIQVLSEEEMNLGWQGTGFVIDPIDGSWNYLFGYPAYCRVVSYLEQGHCQFFSIFSEVDQRSICSNGEQVFCDGRKVSLPLAKNPMIAVMYNMHYGPGKKRALLGVFEQLMSHGQNIRVSGSPGYDLYSLLNGAVGGVVNLSPHWYDASPILNCLHRSPLFEIQDLTVDKNTVGQYIRRHELSYTIRDLI